MQMNFLMLQAAALLFIKSVGGEAAILYYQTTISASSHRLIEGSPKGVVDHCSVFPIAM